MRWCAVERRAYPLALLSLALVLAPALLPAAAAHPQAVTSGTEHRTINVIGLRPDPVALDVRQGDHVVWRNLDSNHVHRIVSDNGTFDSGNILPNRQYEWIFGALGNFTYRCHFHPNLTIGVVRVGAPPPPNNPPVVAIEAPLDGARVAGKIEISGTADDPDGDPFGLWIRVDGSRWTQFNAHSAWRVSLDTSGYKNGDHFIDVQARDKWGERSVTATVRVEVANPSKEREGIPTVAITAPLPNAKLSGEVMIEGIAGRPTSTSDLIVKVRIDGGAWREALGEEHWSYAWDTRTVKDGVHKVEAVSSDGKRDGPLSRVNVLVTNSGTAQATVQILSPAERQKANGTIAVRGVADDPDSDDLRIFSRTDGGEWRRVASGRAWEFEIDTGLLANGPHVVEVYAATPERKSAIAKVTIVTSNGERLDRPVVEFISPAENARLQGVVLVRGRANSSNELPITVQVRIGDEPWEAVSGTAKWAWTLNTTELPNGLHRLRARAFNDVSYSAVVELPILVANAPAPLVFEEDEDREELVTAIAPSRKRAPSADEKSFLPGPGPAALVALASVAALALRRRA